MSNYGQYKPFGYGGYGNYTPYTPQQNQFNQTPMNQFNQTPMNQFNANQQVNTNKVLVTSADAALNMSVQNGSDFVYFDQDKDLVYDVVTDWNGRKELRVFELIEKSSKSTNIKPEDFEQLIKRVEALENMNKGATENAKQNE